MAEYSPSKIIKDGNTYNFRDTTKIPLAGSNAISGSLIPATTDAYDLGGPSYQWNNAYIKSLTINGTACGDILTHNASEFVDVSTAQTISGDKTFIGRLIYKATNAIAGDSTSGNFAGSFNFIDKNGVQLGTLGLGVFNNNGYTEQTLSIINPAWFNDNTKTKILGVRLRVINETEETSFTSSRDKRIDLGTSTNRWKSFNGIAPDELGLPTGTYTDVSSYITHFDYTANTFTAPVSGMIYIDGGEGDVIFENSTLGYLVNFNRNPRFGSCRAIMFISKGDIINVYCDYNNFTLARIYPLKGKV